jgi:diketogulonate reductase-like aldo/keto reductase
MTAQPKRTHKEELMMSQTQEITIPTVTLNNGVRIPQLGFGVFQIPPGDTQRIVEDALEAGYRHIDTAAAYRNETGVGAALAASGIPREEIFITTKLRNGEQGHALDAFRTSREALGLDYVDLYLIHWPVPSQGRFTEAWKSLETFHADGPVRAIGVSNFLAAHLDTLLAASDIVPAVNQIEIHPAFAQQDLAAKSRSLGIAVESCSPLGQGAELGAVTVKNRSHQIRCNTGTDCARLAPLPRHHRHPEVSRFRTHAGKPGRGRPLAHPGRNSRDRGSGIRHPHRC